MRSVWGVVAKHRVGLCWLIALVGVILLIGAAIYGVTEDFTESIISNSVFLAGALSAVSFSILACRFDKVELNFLP